MENPAKSCAGRWTDDAEETDSLYQPEAMAGQYQVTWGEEKMRREQSWVCWK